MMEPDFDNVIHDLVEAGWERQSGVGFVELVGPLWRHRSPGLDQYAIYTMPKHRRRRGVVQGGC
jgi:hypothetical protein